MTDDTTDTLMLADAPMEAGRPIRIAPGVQMTHVGAVINPTLDFENFCHALQNCQQIANGALWTLGDLLLYGESRGDWGEMYTQAVDVTKKSYATLSQAVRLSKAYPTDQRVPSVSWSHHREALAVKDPAERHALLLRASSEGFSRETVRAIAVGDSPTPPPAHTCPQCGHQW
jgi:hypothetical protein